MSSNQIKSSATPKWLQEPSQTNPSPTPVRTDEPLGEPRPLTSSEQQKREFNASQISAAISLKEMNPKNHRNYLKLVRYMPMSSNGASQIVPARMRVVQSFGNIIARVPGATFFIDEYRLGSLYDPDFTGAGHQPSGFDQMMALYQNFIVMRARVSIIGQSPGNQRWDVLSSLNTVSAGGSTVQTLIARPFTQQGAYCGTGCPALHLNREWVDLPSFFGMKPEEYRAEQRFWGTASANPTEALLNSFTFLSADTSNTSVHYQIRIDYDVEYFTRVNFVSS